MKPGGQDQGDWQSAPHCQREAPGSGGKGQLTQYYPRVGRRSGPQTPAPLGAGLVPRPPESLTRPPRPLSLRLRIPAPGHGHPSPRAPSPSTSHRPHGRSRHIKVLAGPLPVTPNPTKCLAGSAEAVQQRRDFPSASTPDGAPSGRKRRAGPTGRGLGPIALGHLPTAWYLGSAAAPDTGRRDPAPNPGSPGSAAGVHG